MFRLGGRKFVESIDPDLEDSLMIESILFSDALKKMNSFRIVYHDDEPIGCVLWRLKENTVCIDMMIVNPLFIDESSYFHVSALFVNKLIRDYHPEKFEYNGLNKQVKIALRRNQFFPKGKLMQRIIEPYRYAVKDRAFDEEGYIINQGLLEVLPFGFFDSKTKGCGWISAFNLLKMNGREMTMFEVANAVGDKDLFGEMFGHSIYALHWWLKRLGLNVHLTQLVKEMCVSKMKESEAGIFLYRHRHGAHYVTYRRIANDKYRFYNAVYGESNHEMSVEEFVNQFTTLPISYLIWMDELEIK